jgi:predicted DNA-binding ribbon-helix-helix protein
VTEHPAATSVPIGRNGDGEAQALEKRSITISGHRTSLALEPEFWAALEDMARVRLLSMAGLIMDIDRARGGSNLASACRLAALDYYRARSEDAFKAPSEPLGQARA